MAVSKNKKAAAPLFPRSKIYNEQNKLEQLSPEETAYMEEFKVKWTNMFFSGSPIDEQAAQEALNWIYKNKLNLAAPDICVVDSPQAVQYACNLFLNNRYTRKQAAECAKVANLLSSQGAEGKAKLKEMCGTLKTYNSSNFLNILDWGWVAYYSYFLDIGVDYGDAEEPFTYFRKLLEACVYSTLLLDEVVIVSRIPVEIHQNEQNRAHNPNGPAFRFADNFSIYYLNGISFGYTGDCDLYLKLTSGQMQFKDILQISNIDQRTQALRYSPPEDFFKHTKAKVLDSYEKKTKAGVVIKYALMKVPAGDVFSEEAYYMYYNCPSTGKQYISGVQAAKSVAEAMAWKFKTTPDVWRSLEPDISES